MINDVSPATTATVYFIKTPYNHVESATYDFADIDGDTYSCFWEWNYKDVSGNSHSVKEFMSSSFSDAVGLDLLNKVHNIHSINKYGVVFKMLDGTLAYRADKWIYTNDYTRITYTKDAVVGLKKGEKKISVMYGATIGPVFEFKDIDAYDFGVIDDSRSGTFIVLKDNSQIVEANSSSYVASNIIQLKASTVQSYGRLLVRHPLYAGRKLVEPVANA